MKPVFSTCSDCGHQILLMHKIPILSHLVLKGACYRCKTPFSCTYITLETGFLLSSVIAILVLFNGTFDKIVFTIFLAWIFLIPLFKIFYQPIKLSEKMILFYLAGFVSYAIITHWVALNSGTSVQVAVISFLAICTFYSLYWVLFCLILHFFEKRKCTPYQSLLV